MKCQEILNVLLLYRDQLIKILELDSTVNATLTSAYSFVRFDTDSIHLEFQVTSNGVKLDSSHGIAKDVEDKIKTSIWPTFDSRSANTFPEHIDKRLTAIDSVASLAWNCTRGDDYWPGYFSKVIYSNNQVELQQVNYMNAKSLKHKNDYSLRSLVFVVPFDETAKMSVEFNDRSSENNRHCGDKIQAALDWMPD